MKLMKTAFAVNCNSEQKANIDSMLILNVLFYGNTLVRFRKDIIMKPNVGGLDRAFRIIGGLVLLILGIIFSHAGVWGIVFIILGALLFATGLIRFCFLYVPFGISTLSGKSGSQPPDQAAH